jgi:hypothetical protein
MMTPMPTTMVAATAVENTVEPHQSFGASLHAASMASLQTDADAVAAKTQRGKASAVESAKTADSAPATVSSTLQPVPVVVPQQPMMSSAVWSANRIESSEPRSEFESLDCKDGSAKTQSEPVLSSASRTSSTVAVAVNAVQKPSRNGASNTAQTPSGDSKPVVATLFQTPVQPIATNPNPPTPVQSSPSAVAPGSETQGQSVTTATNPAWLAYSSSSDMAPAFHSASQPITSVTNSARTLPSNPSVDAPAFQQPIQPVETATIPAREFNSSPVVATTALPTLSNIASEDTNPSSALHSSPNVTVSASQKSGQSDTTEAHPDSAHDSNAGVSSAAATPSAPIASTNVVLPVTANPSAKQIATSIPSNASIDQNQPLPAAPATSLPAPAPTSNDSITPDQLRALALSVSGLIPGGQVAAPVSNSGAVMSPSSKSATRTNTDSDSTAIKDSTASKQHSQSVSDEAGSKTTSQDSSTSGDQTRSGATSQDQNVPSAPISVAAHSAGAINHDQASTQASPAQIAPAIAHGTSAAAKVPEESAQVAAPVPQPLPAINSARLIQSMSQSELRVGMRTTEFGNISISTSTTRDLISAQISVDHGELAKTIAAGLPEMQSKLAGNQGMDVRIDMNGTSTGHGAGASSDMASGSRDQSRGTKQSAGNSAQGNSGTSLTERQYVSAAAIMTTTEGRPSARLDIRV